MLFTFVQDVSPYKSITFVKSLDFLAQEKQNIVFTNVIMLLSLWYIRYYMCSQSYNYRSCFISSSDRNCKNFSIENACDKICVRFRNDLKITFITLITSRTSNTTIFVNLYYPQHVEKM